VGEAVLLVRWLLFSLLYRLRRMDDVMQAVDGWQGKPKYSYKSCPSANLSTTNPTWPDHPLVEAGKNTSTVIPASNLRWDRNVWLWVLRESDHWQIALQITDPSSRQRGRPKTKSKATVRQIKWKRKIWSWARKGCPTPRHIDWLTVSSKVTSTSTSTWPKFGLNSSRRFGKQESIHQRHCTT
jgi:hypothetical protein